MKAKKKVRAVRNLRKPTVTNLDMWIGTARNWVDRCHILQGDLDCSRVMLDVLCKALYSANSEYLAVKHLLEAKTHAEYLERERSRKFLSSLQSGLVDAPRDLQGNVFGLAKAVKEALEEYSR